jgi:tRNA threonylcarbamoyladenosine biosynthesis protein TsaB
VIILGLDTCLNACGVAVLDGERVLAAAREPMARGHQERLASLARDVVAQAGIAFDDLERIGVTVGPGSFTGLRVGLAFAKGLAAALDIPAVGVGVLEGLAAEAAEGRTIAAVDARRDQVYLQAFEDGAALGPPQALAIADALALTAAQGPANLVGSGAPLLAAAAPGAVVILAESVDPVQAARLAARKPAHAPAPLYLRAPDARLPGA